MTNITIQRVIPLCLGAAAFSCGGTGPPAEETTSPTRAAVSVRATHVSVGNARSWVIGEGTARAVSRDYLTFEGPGRVAYLQPGLRVGSPVRAGDVLARQDQREVEADRTAAEATVDEATAQLTVAEAELVQADTEREVAQSNLDRYSVLLDQNAASRQEYDEARARLAQAEASVTRARNRIAAVQSQIRSAEARRDQVLVRQEDTILRASIDGVVAYLNIEEGVYFTPSIIRTDTEQAALTSIPVVVIDPTQYEVTVEVPAFERGRVSPGQDAMLVVNDEFSQAALGRLEQGPAEQVLPLTAADASRAMGAVYSVTPAVSPGARSVQVRIRTTVEAEHLQDGVFTTAWIATEQREGAIVVPLSALIYLGNQPFCFVVEEGRARRVPVTLGIQDFDTQEIVSGLEPGDLVVTEGRFQLSDGAPVRVLPSDDGEVTHEGAPS